MHPLLLNDQHWYYQASEVSQSVVAFNQVKTIVQQNQQEILLKRCSQVQFVRVFETQSIPGSGIVSPNILVRIKVSKNSLWIFSELFPDTSIDAYNEMFSTVDDMGDTRQAQIAVVESVMALQI